MRYRVRNSYVFADSYLVWDRAQDDYLRDEAGEPMYYSPLKAATDLVESLNGDEEVQRALDAPACSPTTGDHHGYLLELWHAGTPRRHDHCGAAV